MDQPQWESRIKEAWRNASPPGERVVRDCFELNPAPGDFYDCDPIDAQSFLSSKRWDEFLGDHRFDIEQPLFYLTDEASAYYVGGYLLHMCKDFEIVDLPTIHAIGFLGSERFDDTVPFWSVDQQAVIAMIAREMAEQPEIFGLEPKDVSRLERAARKLGSELP